MLLLNVYLEKMHYVKCSGSGCLKFFSAMGTKVLNIAVEEEGAEATVGGKRDEEERRKEGGGGGGGRDKEGGGQDSMYMKGKVFDACPSGNFCCPFEGIKLCLITHHCKRIFRSMEAFDLTVGPCSHHLHDQKKSLQLTFYTFST